MPGYFLSTYHRSNESADTLIKFADMLPTSADAAAVAAHALHDAGRNEESEIYFQRALTLDPRVTKLTN